MVFQLSASHGSTRSVVLFTLTNAAWVSSATRLEVESRAIRRLNVCGSDLTDPTKARPAQLLDGRPVRFGGWRRGSAGGRAYKRKERCGDSY